MASLDGMDGWLADVRRIGVEGPQAVRDADYEQAVELLGRAKAAAPVDKGDLRDSGKVRKTKKGWDVVFGGKKVPYANYQHEHVGLTHKQGGPKYLEAPLSQMVPQIGEARQAAFNRVIGA